MGVAYDLAIALLIKPTIANYTPPSSKSIAALLSLAKMEFFIKLQATLPLIATLISPIDVPKSIHPSIKI